MTINTENIIRNSDIMFDILNNALSKSNDIKEEIAKISVKEKVQSNKNMSMESAIDIYA
ncbi:hypothetical protein KAS50_05850 [bacterium]|nr:hypothetical protein [bacterium]